MQSNRSVQTSQYSNVERVNNQIIIIGTIHVSSESIQVVRDTILELKPSIVALELDEGRLLALTNATARTNKLGFGISFLLITLLERFAGNMTGSSPGGEMLKAAEAAREVGAQIQFIDIPIQNTIVGIRKLPRGEKIRLGLDSLVSIMLFPFAKSNISRLGEEFESQIILFRQRYPRLSHVLLEEREAYMAKRIQELSESTSGRVVAVVGLGHVKSLVQRLRTSTKLHPQEGFSTTIQWTITASVNL